MDKSLVLAFVTLSSMVNANHEPCGAGPLGLTYCGKKWEDYFNADKFNNYGNNGNGWNDRNANDGVYVDNNVGGGNARDSFRGSQNNPDGRFKDQGIGQFSGHGGGQFGVERDGSSSGIINKQVTNDQHIDEQFIGEGVQSSPFDKQDIAQFSDKFNSQQGGSQYDRIDSGYGDNNQGNGYNTNDGNSGKNSRCRGNCRKTSTTNIGNGRKNNNEVYFN